MVLYTRIDRENFTDADKKLLKNISEYRQHFITNNKSDKTRLLSLYAELLLIYGLENYYDVTDKVDIKIRDGGKPYLTNISGIDFNLSHTTKMVMCGISNTGNIGVDVEHLRDVNKNVSKKICHLDEIKYIADNKEHFFEIWTKKEAYTKYLGTGLRYNLTDINLLSDEHSSHLNYWQQDEYFFSVYSDEKNTPIDVSLDTLIDYFL